MKAEIDDRGRGPEIKGTRITVYDVYGCRERFADEFVAENYAITLEQLKAAYDYIDAHKQEMDEDIARIDAREAEERRKQENSPKLQASVRKSREMIKAIKERIAREKAETVHA